jgi:hypothetical protein
VRIANHGNIVMISEDLVLSKNVAGHVVFGVLAELTAADHVRDFPLDAYDVELGGEIGICLLLDGAFRFGRGVANVAQNDCPEFFAVASRVDIGNKRGGAVHASTTTVGARAAALVAAVVATV